MKKSMIISLARMIKHYELGSSSYYVGGADALRSFLEGCRFTCSYQGSMLVVHDWKGLEVVRV